MTFFIYNLFFSYKSYCTVLYCRCLNKYFLISIFIYLYGCGSGNMIRIRRGIWNVDLTKTCFWHHYSNCFRVNYPPPPPPPTYHCVNCSRKSWRILCTLAIDYASHDGLALQLLQNNTLTINNK